MQHRQSSSASCVPPLPNAETLDLLSSTTPSHLTSSATQSRRRACGLVNTGSMCFANAVLQLPVHSPPLLNVEPVQELGDLKGQRRSEGPETGSAATPHVDVTVRFFEESTFEEKEPHSQTPGVKPREDEEAKKTHNVVDSFEPTYMYDATKEKRQLKHLLVRCHDQDSKIRPPVADMY